MGEGEKGEDYRIMPVINEFTTEFNQLNHHRKITSKSQQILGNFHFFHFFFLFIFDVVVRRASSSSFLAEVFFCHGY